MRGVMKDNLLGIKKSTLVTLWSIAIVIVAGCGASDKQATSVAPVVANHGAMLDKLVDSYFEKLLELNPVFATSIGDPRYNDRFAVDIGTQWLADSLAVEQEYMRQANELDADKLDDAARLTLDIFKYNRQLNIDDAKFRNELLPVSQFGSTPVEFGRLGSGEGVQPFRNVKDYDGFLKRIDGFALWSDQAIANMKIGIDSGIVLPKPLVEKALPQLASFIVDDPRTSLFYKPLENFPDGVSPDDRKRLNDAYTKSIREVAIPAYRRLYDFMKNEYLPKARTSVGMSALPQGDKWYTQLARRGTTTDLTPEQIHDIGVKEMARIHGEMERVKTQVGFKGDLKEFMKQLRSDPQFVHKSPQELVNGYTALKERVSAALPKLFDLQPKMPFEVRAVEAFREKSEATGSYQPGLPDGTRPGVFFANTYDLAARPKFMMETIFLHEALPGHHMQIAIQYELENLPRFRRFGGDTAYVEGWGLYAESLGKELGMYQDPYQYFGSLTAEAWRAARLVVDTGMHAKGWTREQAIDYMRDNTAVGETDIVAEVERYIAIPGQALAYKIGQLKIRELRTRAEQKLGPKFNIREFHSQILKDGSMPLAVLDAKIDRWIAARK
jgi:uncharacterized protein (DUF885 family)